MVTRCSCRSIYRPPQQNDRENPAGAIKMNRGDSVHVKGKLAGIERHGDRRGDQQREKVPEIG